MRGLSWGLESWGDLLGVMLSIGEVQHSSNMGFSRGGAYGRDVAYGRDAYGPEASVGSGSNVALQQQLNDLIHNSYLMSHGVSQCSTLSQVDTACLLSSGGGSSAATSGFGHHGLTSMGFSQSDIDRPILFDDFPPVVDVHHESNHHPAFVSVSNAHASVSSFAPVGLATSASYAGLPAMSLQPQLARERWVDATLASPRGLKLEVGLDQINMQPARKSAKLDKSTRSIDTKSKRPNEQADHILRERQRRDDMTSKFAVLESLLPIGVKVIPLHSNFVLLKLFVMTTSIVAEILDFQ